MTGLSSAAKEAASTTPISTAPNVPITLSGLASPESARSLIAGAEGVRFDLTDLYQGIHDPQIMKDLETVERMYRDFCSRFRGNLTTLLGDAMIAWEEMARLQDKVEAYFILMNSCNVTDQEIQAIQGVIKERLSAADGEHFTFFEIELGAMDEAAYQRILQADDRLAHYTPKLQQIRESASHLLSEEVERALTIRSPFGASEWMEYSRERAARMRYTMEGEVFAGEEIAGKKLKQEEVLKIISYHPRREVRAEALRIFNTQLAEERVPLSTRMLNLIIGRKAVEDAERGYANPMTDRNTKNMVSDQVVDSLHRAVVEVGTQYCKRYYKLVAAQLGQDTLLWSDRNVRVAGSETLVPWDDALSLVRAAYRSFSPTLAELVDQILINRRVDAPLYANKNSGAFNLSCVFPEPLGARSYIFLNYQGQPRDVGTLAHELGHGVHGMVAGARQGALMASAPIAFAETASIFAEMVAFEYLKARVQDPIERYGMLMDKIGDFMNSVVRQISFSEFEKSIHARRKEGKLTSKEFDQAWVAATHAFYGAPGEVFTYEHMDHLWAYVSHFARPFYVYGYAFGELLTQSLFAVKDNYGDQFEPRYLELLAAGGTKDAISLLRPFNLNPEDPNFWVAGMHASVGKWLDEAEELSQQFAGSIG